MDSGWTAVTASTARGHDVAVLDGGPRSVANYVGSPSVFAVCRDVVRGLVLRCPPVWRCAQFDSHSCARGTLQTDSTGG